MINIYQILAALLAYTLMFEASRVISNEKYRLNAFDILIIIIVAAINILSLMVSNNLLKGIITLIGFILFSAETHRKVNKSALVDGFIMYLYVLIIDTLMAMAMFAMGYSKFMTDTNNLDLYKLIYTDVFGIVLLIVLKLGFVKKIINKLRSFLLKNRISTFVMILVFLIFEFSTIFALMNTTNKKEIILSFSLITIIAIQIFAFIYNLVIENNLKMINNNLILQNESFNKMIDNYKMFKHNMKHELSAISSIGSKKVKELVASYLDEYENCEINNINDISKAPIILKNIMYQKVLMMKDFNSQISIDNFVDNKWFDSLSINKLCKLSQCFGIIFDNAIEAANEISNGFVYLKIFISNDNVCIECCNNFDNINETIIFSDVQTKKPNHMGIGREYLNSQNIFNITTTIRNNIYKVKIEIKK